MPTLYTMVAPCFFGTESTLNFEVKRLGAQNIQVTDGRVAFQGGADIIAAANLNLRTAERVLLLLATYKATTFDELFDGCYNIAWEELLPADAAFPVKGSSLSSQLSSVPACQSIVKKAIVKRLMAGHKTSTLPESGALYKVRFALRKDTVEIYLDTSGDGLHKRGYRKNATLAPIKETLAAAIIDLGRIYPDTLAQDPFCGSGTFPIEAAMIAAGIAPGMNREFTAEQWTNLIDRKLWYECVKEAEEMIHTDVKVDIQGYDIDGDVIKAARENAKRAGVDHLIHFQQRPVAELHHPKKYGFLIMNPPYGERIEDKEALPELYREIGERFAALDSWSAFMITSYEDAEKYMGRKADRNRKIYNGIMKTYFYQFLGPKPPRRNA